LKQVTIMSGKGGTGKTTFSSIVHSVEGDVIADCDVDAPNLHMILEKEIISVEAFISGEKAEIGENCTGCGLCYKLCRFSAIGVWENNKFKVNHRKCEGCAFCYYVCPSRAITMKKIKTGNIFVSRTDYGKIVYARLIPGEENSGKLAAEVRERAKKIANDFVVIDAPPGIGCPVMASLAGVDAAIIVTEPTLSGLGDMVRAVELTKNFRIKSFVVINKYNLNENLSAEIRQWCRENDVMFAGTIPYDEEIPKQMSILKFPFKGKAAEKIREIWIDIKSLL